jgi:hypothetical protein
VTAFKTLINPTLSAAYASGHGTFIDVTAKTGAYTPLSTTVNVPKYGTIPAAVASVCTLTWYCALGNIHPTDAGYTAIGRLIVSAYDATTPT